jgi:hypothetical protein
MTVRVAAERALGKRRSILSDWLDFQLVCCLILIFGAAVASFFIKSDYVLQILTHLHICLRGRSVGRPCWNGWCLLLSIRNIHRS